LEKEIKKGREKREERGEEKDLKTEG